MSEHDALLRAVLETPDDDTVRLVYADWLDENAGIEKCPACLGAGKLYRSEPEGTGGIGYTRVGGTVWKLGIGEEVVCFSCEGGGRETVRAKRAAYIREAIANPSFEFVDLTRGGNNPFELLGIEDDIYQGWGGEPARLIGIAGRYRPDRGFVQTVVVQTVDELCRDCEACYGQTTGCEACRDTSYIAGRATPLFNRHPITAMWIFNRAPYPIHHSGGYRPPSWHRLGGVPSGYAAAYLPAKLYSLVREQDMHIIQGPGEVLSYEDRMDAFAALSAACVAFGRELAGLNQLPLKEDT